MTHRIIQGDDVRLTITVKEDGSPVDISGATTVTVGLVHANALEASGTASSGTSGADWANGIIVIVFSAVQTATLTVNANVSIEVEVDDTTISSWIKDDFLEDAQTIRVHASLL